MSGYLFHMLNFLSFYLKKKLDVLGMNLLVEKLIGCGVGKQFQGLCQAWTSSED